MLLKALCTLSLHFGNRRGLTKLLRIMKITAIILLTAALHTSANGLAQKVTLSLKKVPVQKVFSEVIRQTGISIVYTESMFEGSMPVSIEVKDASISEVLDQCLRNQPFSYYVEGSTIIIKKKSSADGIQSPHDLTPIDVKGKVVNEKGEPLEGVSVTVKGTKKVTVTNSNGVFSTDAKVNDVLEFTYVGYGTKQIKVTGETNEISVQLILENKSLTEVVMTGYSSKKATEISGSVQRISGAELMQGVSSTNTLSMLKGKVAGLYILEGGGSVGNKGQIIMRGQASFADAGNTNFSPLIVLDGVITTAVNLQDIVNPNDIESITVLKDAASTAIYGSRAAQGVIVITTKRGSKGQVRVNLNMKYGQTKDNRLVRFMNTVEMTSFINKYMEGMYNATASIRSQFPTLQDFYNTTRPFKDADVNKYQNWDKVLFTDGHEKDINLSISAGSDKTKIYGALDWYKEDGTALESASVKQIFNISKYKRYYRPLSYQ